jgi:hypothetical protein
MRVKRKTKRTPLTALQERIKKRQLAEEDWAVLEGMTKTLETLSLALLKYGCGLPLHRIERLRDTWASPSRLRPSGTSYTPPL